MKIIDLRQNTPEWERWRMGGVGASDATIVSGCETPWPNPKTARTLWELKTGRAQPEESTYPQRRGQMLEPTIRELYRQRTGLEMPGVCVEHDDMPWLRASLDGLSEWGDLVLEIKAPRIESHEEALAGKVPSYYWPQVQHQLAVSGVPLLHYVSYSIKKGLAEADRFALVEVRPEPEYIRELLEKEAVFWMRVVMNYWPDSAAA